MSFLTIENISKVFNANTDAEVTALDNINLSIDKGEFAVLSGPSGSGKSTLLNMIGALDSATSGAIHLEGVEVTAMSESQLADFRRDSLGFVFQAYNLIPVLTVKENIEYIMKLQGISQAECDVRVAELASTLDIEALLNKLPDHLSGGQQQRVAVARAVATKPKLILADEPTANLDSKNSAKLMEMMKLLNEKENITIIFSSHDPMVTQMAKKLIVLHDGAIVEIK